MLVGQAKGTVAAKQFIDDNTQAVDIGVVIYRVPLMLLRRGIGWCVWTGFCVGGESGIVLIFKLDDAKIGEKDTSISVPEKVMWFDITVYQVVAMGCIKGWGNLLEDGGDTCEG